MSAEKAAPLCVVVIKLVDARAGVVSLPAPLIFSRRPILVGGETVADHLPLPLPVVACVEQYARCGRLLITIAPWMKRTPKSDPSRRSNISPAEHRALIVSQRLAAVKRFGDARAAGKTWAEASRIAGISPASISRYGKMLHADSLAGLEPKTANCGSKSALKRWNVTPEIVAAVVAILRENVCTPLDAWQRYALTAACPPVLSSHLLKSVPPSLITAVQNTLA